MKNVRLIRKDESAVSPVIATILMVAITVVLAAVLYVMVSGLLSGPGATKPKVTFGTVTAIPNGYTFSVAENVAAPGQFAAGNYKVNYQVNSTTGATPVLLQPSMSVVVGASTYTIAWIDPGGGGLNGGDRFEITRAGGIPISTTFTFYLLWSDGSAIQTLAYTT